MSVYVAYFAGARQPRGPLEKFVSLPLAQRHLRYRAGHGPQKVVLRPPLVNRNIDWVPPRGTADAFMKVWHRKAADPVPDPDSDKPDFYFVLGPKGGVHKADKAERAKSKAYVRT